jgi:arsenate reductase
VVSVTIYHNPACSNSRGTLALLREHGIEPVVIEYLKAPLGAAQLRALADALAHTQGGAWPGLRDGMLRTQEAVYGELALDNASDTQLLDAVAAHPTLLNRPIVATDKGTRLCRPPETVLQLL